MGWPDFYIVGAPRCGTSFMWWYLGQHPDVFVPSDKEIPFFCRDLHTGTLRDRKRFLSRDAWLSRFDGAQGMVGEACAYDLFSPGAARLIHHHRPDARILIARRDPQEQMRSWHNIRVAHGEEDRPFHEALALQPARARGHDLPRHPYLVPFYQYEAVASFDEQIARYLEVFPPEQVLVTQLEDIRADPRAAFDRLTNFLGLAQWRPASFERVNSSVEIRHPTALRLLTDERLIEGAKRLVPRRLHSAAGRAALRIRRATGRRARDRLDWR